MTTSPEPVTTNRQFGDATGVELFTAYQAYKGAEATERLANITEAAALQAAAAVSQSVHENRMAVLRAGEAARRASSTLGTTPDLAARIYEADLLVEQMDREFDTVQRQVFGDDESLRRDFGEAAAHTARIRAGITPRVWGRGALGLLFLAWATFGLIGLFMGGSLGMLGLALVFGYYGFKYGSEWLGAAVPTLRQQRANEALAREEQLGAELVRRGLHPRNTAGS